jgi:DNA-binding winged helix-turn-helix (wHTH) protein/TolB-like protein/Tfp pilus assembly protein PilF
MHDTIGIASHDERYRFGVFEFDAAALELRKNGRIVRVRPQSLKLLTLLLARPGEVASRDEIQHALWGHDTFVDFEQGVNHAIRELRSVVGDTAESPRFIQTLARRGYRFIAPVERLTSDAPPHPDAAAVALSPKAGRGRNHRRWITLAASLAVAGVAALAALLIRSRAPAVSQQIPTIAVVRFASPDSDPALGAGLALAISSRLEGQQRAFVRWVPTAISTPASSNGWSQADLRGATLVLSGEVFRKEDDVAVAARLENVATGEVVWTQRLQLRAHELHSLENVIAERVVTALDLQMAAAEQERLRRRYTDNAAAYEDYLRGRAHLVRYTPESTLGAIEAFESALRRDPDYALARAGLAMACADMCLRFAPSKDVERWGQRAETEARAALDLDSNLAEAHLARAAVARKREFDWNLAIESSRRALVLNPNLDQANYFIAAAYYHSGYMEEALIEVQNGQRLRGLDSVEPIRIQGLIALLSGNYAPAKVHLEEVSRQSDKAIGDTYLALAYYYSGSVDQALALLKSLAASSSASSASRAGAALASILARRKQVAEARGHLEAVLKREYRDHHVAYWVGTSYAQLGSATEAMQWLRTAADTGFPCLIWFERDPLLDPLRGDSKFAELLEYVRSRREVALR